MGGQKKNGEHKGWKIFKNDSPEGAHKRKHRAGPKKNKITGEAEKSGVKIKQNKVGAPSMESGKLAEQKVGN